MSQDTKSGLWYNPKTKYYYVPQRKLYARAPEGPWMRYDAKLKKLVPADA